MKRMAVVLAALLAVLTPIPQATAGSDTIEYRGRTQQDRKLEFRLVERTGGPRLRWVRVHFRAHCEDGTFSDGISSETFQPAIALDDGHVDIRTHIGRIVGTFWPNHASGEIRVVLVSFGPGDDRVCRTPWLDWTARRRTA
jgi:hypothetical protein